MTIFYVSRSASLPGWRIAGMAVVLMAAFGPSAGAAEATPALELAQFCAVPQTIIPDGFLKHAREAYRAGKRLRIVAFGTSSSAGAGATKSDDSYPARLQADLQERFTVPVEVINKSIGGQSARQMASRLEDDVVSLQPSLVIWQTGTTDSVGSLQVDDFGRALSEGIEMLDKEGIDVILMNMQYARRLGPLVNYRPYLDMMNVVVTQSDAVLFDRIEMMRHWASGGHLDFDNMPRAERASNAVKLHECIAVQMGNIIEKAIRR